METVGLERDVNMCVNSWDTRGSAAPLGAVGWERWEAPGWSMIQVFFPSLPPALPYPQGNEPVTVVLG